MQLFDSLIHSTLCPSAPIEQYWLLYLFVSHSGLNVAPNVTENVVKFNNCTRSLVCGVLCNYTCFRLVMVSILQRRAKSFAYIFSWSKISWIAYAVRHDVVESATLSWCTSTGFPYFHHEYTFRTFSLPLLRLSRCSHPSRNTLMCVLQCVVWLLHDKSVMCTVHRPHICIQWPWPMNVFGTSIKNC